MQSVSASKCIRIKFYHHFLESISVVSTIKQMIGTSESPRKSNDVYENVSDVYGEQQGSLRLAGYHAIIMWHTSRNLGFMPFILIVITSH